MRSESAAQTVVGTLKWFSRSKGYGFIELPDKPDALLHITRLHERNIPVPAPGSTISCDVVDRAGKLAVSAIHAVTSPSGPIVECKVQPVQVQMDDSAIEGIVKLYKPDRGYGFIQRSDGQSDIFVHRITLKECGLASLTEGQSVRVRIGPGERGPKVNKIVLV